MSLAKPIEEYDCVEVWAQSLKQQWGGDPMAEEPAKLDHLREFCEFVGMDPDAVVAYCFLRKRETGEKFLSVKRRQDLTAKLRACRDARESESKTQRRVFAADALSFLIHNGVQMNAGSV